MSLRDLGYRPYEGERHPPSHNTWVLYRHSFGRSWSSWFVKIAAVFGWIPAAIGVILVAVQSGIAKMAASSSPDGAKAVEKVLGGASMLRSLLDWQFWLFVTLVTLGAGATALARDFEFKAFRFYLSKPVEPWQYLGARTLAVFTWCFLLMWVPATIFVIGATAVLGKAETMALVFPATIQAIVVSAAMSVASIGVSSISKSRGVTMSVWVVVLLVPHILGGIVATVAKFPWLLLTSLPALVGSIGDALFKQETHGRIEWYYALAVLIAAGVGIAFLTYRRIEQAEVIA